jgi:hypothetical protein
MLIILCVRNKLREAGQQQPGDMRGIMQKPLSLFLSLSISFFLSL